MAVEKLVRYLETGSAPAGLFAPSVFPLIVDLIAVPLVVVVGVVIGRVVPSGWRRYVSAASALTILLALVAFPFLTGLGRRPDNTSLLDRNYWLGYLSLVALVWGLPQLLRFAQRIPRPGRRAR